MAHSILESTFIYCEAKSDESLGLTSFPVILDLFSTMAQKDQLCLWKAIEASLDNYLETEKGVWRWKSEPR